MATKKAVKKKPTPKDAPKQEIVVDVVNGPLVDSFKSNMTSTIANRLAEGYTLVSQSHCVGDMGGHRVRESVLVFQLGN